MIKKQHLKSRILMKEHNILSEILLWFLTEIPEEFLLQSMSLRQCNEIIENFMQKQGLNDFK